MMAQRVSRGTVLLYSLALALNDGGWLKPHPSCFTAGKETQYPLHRRLCGPKGKTGQVQEISPPPEFNSQTVQPAASRCTDYMTFHIYIYTKEKTASIPQLLLYSNFF
jgi:hypothetical protein